MGKVEVMDDVPVRASNPFGAAVSAPSQEMSGGMAVTAERERQEVMAQILLAKQFPRDVTRCTDRILNACTRPTLADGATYEYSKGGSNITGPSIRLAETIAQYWGNIQFGVREIETTGTESKVEAFAWDMENNVRIVKVFNVSNMRHTRSGTTKLTDPRDIYENIANQGSRRVRACILAVIPGDVVEAAVEQCEITLKATVQVTPESIAKMVEAFAAYNVTPEMISKRIQKHIESMTPAQMLSLRKIYASLKDGMSKPADWFETKKTGTVATDEDPTRGAK